VKKEKIGTTMNAACQGDFSACRRLVNPALDVVTRGDEPFKLQWLLHVSPGYNIQILNNQPTKRIYITFMDLRISNDYLRFIFMIEKECLYCALRSESLNVTAANFCS
jgi:hypothetical protein